jgi:Ni/Co efflux regulator RcnB
MRRTLFAVLVSAVAIAIVPASSLARDHGRGEHQRREREHQRHEREHRRHHERHHTIRHERIGHSPTAPGDNAAAGKVASFTGGVLTIQLNDGSTVSGAVNDFTRIKCEAPESMQVTGDDHGRDGGDNSGSGDNGDRGDQGEPGDDRGDDNGEEQMCSTAALTPNAVVQEAELRISSAGAVWDEVELASQP